MDKLMKKKEDKEMCLEDVAGLEKDNDYLELFGNMRGYTGADGNLENND
jgi:hypothetical protein